VAFWQPLTLDSRCRAELGSEPPDSPEGLPAAGGDAEQHSLDRVSRHRHELDRLYRDLVDEIRTRTGLSPLPVFRYLSGLAEIETREQPECAFVECTTIQAQGHADEIRDRLQVPVTALTTEEIAGKRARIPRHVRQLLTSHFHIAELSALSTPRDLVITPIPIEVSPRLVEDLDPDTRGAFLLETEEKMAHSIAADLERLMSLLPLRTRSVGDVESALEKMLAEDDRRREADLILLSPRVWGAIAEEWRAHPRVRPVTFRICEEAWDLVADTIGLPLGDLGQP
jgi:hypothetical protein